MKERIAKEIGGVMKGFVDAGAWNTDAQNLPRVTIERTKNRIHGDWTTNIAFELARILRNAPQKIAQEIAQGLGKQLDDASVQAVGGHINITLSDKQFGEMLEKIVHAGDSYAQNNVGNGRDVIIEYVSANPTGPVHLGNARGGPYGDTLARVLQKSGYNVHREYYVNDAGNQVDVLGHSILGDEHAQYAGAYIDTLRRRLITTKGESDARSIGEAAAKIIVSEIIKPSLEKAHITFDQWFSEMALHDMGAVDDVIKLLKEGGHVYEKDGAVYFRAIDFGDEKDRVLVKSDGAKTYFCVDVAYHLNKLARAQKLINIWGADHGGTVPRLKGALTALGHHDVLDIILTQFVRVVENGTEVKMSKRSGTYITLEDLVDDVGPDVVRFLFLMQSASSHVVFDLDRAREQSEKNPVFYVQYAHARLESILRKAREDGIEYDDAEVQCLTHEKEQALIWKLAEMPEIIAQTAQDYNVHRLPHYAISIADHLHSFYASCKVIDRGDSAMTKARLMLTAATRDVLAETLRIIGVGAPERM